MKRIFVNYVQWCLLFRLNSINCRGQIVNIVNVDKKWHPVNEAKDSHNFIPDNHRQS